jgi:pyridinium-3,5-bisthiocarboxylic acid mononucleotide nickel chelatase
MHVHLDLSGGLTGDMFIAAGLDAFPQFELPVMAAIDSLDGPYPVACSLLSHIDRDICGRRFEVVPFDRFFGHVPFAFPVVSHGDGGSHEQTTWESVRERLNSAPIAPGIRTHAMNIFELLVEAESGVHGIEPEKVAFQEVGAWDAVAEIVGAAALIDALGGVRWTASVLPLGEVVTLTGASILGYLCAASPGDENLPHVRSLTASGTGFGSRRLSSLNSRMRMVCFDEDCPAMAAPPPAHAAGWAGDRSLRP